MYNEDCPNYQCRDCKHFGSYPNYCTKRVDHKKVEFAAAWFRCDPENSHMPCCEFEPSSINVWDLKNYWSNWENWWMDYLNTWFPYYPKEKPEDNFIYFTLNGNTDIRYGVPLMDYIMGDMYDGNKLKAKKKIYLKRVKNDYGYELIREDIDGVEIE